MELATSQKELDTAKEDARQYAEQSRETQDLYQRELMLHGKSMESLLATKEEVHFVRVVLARMHMYMYVHA